MRVFFSLFLIYQKFLTITKTPVVRWSSCPLCMCRLFGGVVTNSRRIITRQFDHDEVGRELDLLVCLCVLLNVYISKTARGFVMLFIISQMLMSIPTSSRRSQFGKKREHHLIRFTSTDDHMNTRTCDEPEHAQEHAMFFEL